MTNCSHTAAVHTCLSSGPGLTSARTWAVLAEHSPICENQTSRLFFSFFLYFPTQPLLIPWLLKLRFNVSLILASGRRSEVIACSSAWHVRGVVPGNETKYTKEIQLGDETICTGNILAHKLFSTNKNVHNEQIGLTTGADES